MTVTETKKSQNIGMQPPSKTNDSSISIDARTNRIARSKIFGERIWEGALIGGITGGAIGGPAFGIGGAVIGAIVILPKAILEAFDPK